MGCGSSSVARPTTTGGAECETTTKQSRSKSTCNNFGSRFKVVASREFEPCGSAEGSSLNDSSDGSPPFLTRTASMDESSLEFTSPRAGLEDESQQQQQQQKHFDIVLPRCAHLQLEIGTDFGAVVESVESSMIIEGEGWRRSRSVSCAGRSGVSSPLSPLQAANGVHDSSAFHPHNRGYTLPPTVSVSPTICFAEVPDTSTC